MSNECDTSCGLFDFMANEVGIKVLHPGGYEATDELISLCHLNENSHVLDLACGTGTTAFYLSKKYHCQITGIDISENLIEQANRDLKIKKGNISFKVADAFAIPYPDNTFDAVISQAFFVFIDEKEKVMKEIIRVLKPGGYFGALEKSWFTRPTEEGLSELTEKTCKDFIPRVVRFSDWENFFDSENLIHIATSKHRMKSGISKLLKSEGLENFLKIMFKMMCHPNIRNRMMVVQKTFEKYNDYLGYGIYCYKKNTT